VREREREREAPIMWKRSKKPPGELVKALTDAIETPERKKDSKNIEKHLEKASEQVNKYLAQMRIMLYGDDTSDADPAQVAELIDAAVAAELPLLLVRDMGKVGFEARKDISAVLTSMLRKERQTRPPPLATYLYRREDVMQTLLDGYSSPDLALTCGAILREMLRSETLCGRFLESMPRVQRLFDLSELSNFDIASDAFATLRDLLTRHKQLVSAFLQREYDAFFDASQGVPSYTKLLLSENYVTRRQSVKLLGEILLDRINFNTMSRYIADPGNLKRMMNLLRDSSKNIQFEAFHVFKVFVANPNKPPEVVDILRRNRAKLIQYLEQFQNDKDDPQFEEEKGIIIDSIAQLPPFE